MKSTPSRVKPYFLWVIDLLQTDPRVSSVKIIRERYSMENGFIEISVKIKMSTDWKFLNIILFQMGWKIIAIS